MGMVQTRIRSTAARPTNHAALALSPELLQQFYAELDQCGRRADTIQAYSRSLSRLYEFLPPGKAVECGTLERWRDHLLQDGFAAQTVNGHVAAANSLLEYCGRRDLQAPQQLRREETAQPELTRNEYLRLLSTAKALNEEQTYLLVKLFASTGIPVRELPNVTAQALQNGHVVLENKTFLHIPAHLLYELRDYAAREGIAEGPVFRNRNGKLLHRSNINASMHQLCRMAALPEEKGSPRCLCQLYQQTRLGLRSNMELLLEQAYERLMEQEQLHIGWND